MSIASIDDELAEFGDKSSIAYTIIGSESILLFKISKGPHAS
jgi:putative Ca2+/H+ antiporter (TMEM165/GDT1 family)